MGYASHYSFDVSSKRLPTRAYASAGVAPTPPRPVGTFVAEHWSRLLVCVAVAVVAIFPLLLSPILILGGSVGLGVAFMPVPLFFLCAAVTLPFKWYSDFKKMTQHED